MKNQSLNDKSLISAHFCAGPIQHGILQKGVLHLSWILQLQLNSAQCFIALLLNLRENGEGFFLSGAQAISLYPTDKTLENKALTKVEKQKKPT